MLDLRCYIIYNMEPAELDDRELGCIAFFLFCFLLSSGLVWPPSWLCLGLILEHLGSIWDHPGSILGSQSLPKLSQT